MGITWSWFDRMKFQPIQPGQISLSDYMGKPNVFPTRKDGLPPGICLDLFAVSFNIPLQTCVELLFYPVGARWSNYLEKFCPCKVEFQVQEKNPALAGWNSQHVTVEYTL